MKILLLLFIFFTGAGMGSFACCQAQRVRLKETKKKKLGDRSVCLNCGYQLRWFDNIPIFSWIFLGGRCRKCHKKIGAAEILAEIFTGVMFLAVFFRGVMALGTGPVETTEVFRLIILAMMMAVLTFLGVHDAKWGELPNGGLILANVFGVVAFILQLIQSENIVQDIISTIIGVGILAGTYYILYKVSQEKWVGGGDWILCLALSLALGNWWLCLWVMCLANVLGCIVMLPRKKKKVYFGPFLIAAFVIALFFSPEILQILF